MQGLTLRRRWPADISTVSHLVVELSSTPECSTGATARQWRWLMPMDVNLNSESSNLKRLLPPTNNDQCCGSHPVGWPFQMQKLTNCTLRHKSWSMMRSMERHEHCSWQKSQRRNWAEFSSQSQRPKLCSVQLPRQLRQEIQSRLERILQEILAPRFGARQRSPAADGTNLAMAAWGFPWSC